ncbi:MAG: tetratricopeptide repeat protein [candidate division KSB1 bacterium]|nr:tetratricopeptide repeat protein [candidate division KSB1 bacterium]
MEVLPWIATETEKQETWIVDKLQTGIQYARQGNYQQAMEEFRKILVTHPDHALALHNLALMHYQVGDPHQAIETLQKALRIDIEFPEAHNSLGILYFQMGNYTEALKEFKKAIAKNVNYHQAYANYQATAKKLGLSLIDTDTDIVFYTAGIPFNGQTIYETGLGGSESALFYLARELARLGYKVRVFNNCDRPGTYEGVEYGDMVDFHVYRYFNKINILVSLRSLKPFKVPTEAKIKILWVQDNPNVEYLYGETLDGLDIDKIFTLSRYQTEEWMRYFRIPEEKFFITRNGVDLTPFKENSYQRNPNKLIYTSRPTRGLDILLEIFPKIKAKRPEAELHLFTYVLSQDDREMEPLLEKARQPGVFIRGSVSKAELAREMLTSWLMVYPCTFRETSCTSAIEAQAAGLPVITSALAALPETVENGYTGIILDGDPYSKIFQDKLVETTLRLLSDEVEWCRLSKNAQQRTRQYYDWKIIARQWEKEFQALGAI